MTLFKGIRENNFLVIGRVGIDLTPTPPGTRTEDAISMAVGMGGSSANIAAGIVKLGGKAALVTSVSDDSVGRYCLNQLRHYGIDPHYVKSVGGEARKNFVHVHVRRRAATGLVGVDGELVVVLAVDDLVGGAHDGIRNPGVELAEFTVGDRSGALDASQSHDLSRLEAGARDGEVLHSTLRLSAVEGILGHAYLAHGVVFDAVFGGTRHSVVILCLRANWVRRGGGR